MALCEAARRGLHHWLKALDVIRAGHPNLAGSTRLKKACARTQRTLPPIRHDLLAYKASSVKIQKYTETVGIVSKFYKQFALKHLDWIS